MFKYDSLYCKIKKPLGTFRIYLIPSDFCFSGLNLMTLAVKAAFSYASAAQITEESELKTTLFSLKEKNPL